MSARDLELGLASLQFSRFMVLKLLEGVPEDQWFTPPIPGGNHAAWIAGHVAWEDDDYLNMLIAGRESKLPRQWHTCFAQGSTPLPDPSAYPPIDALRGSMAENRAELEDCFKASADILTDPIPREWQGFARDRAGLMHAIAHHEMLHAGQLTVARKHLNLAPAFG